jgi:hypothetical protein
MARDITVTFDDGSSHVYENAPDDVTFEKALSRAETDFKGKAIKNIDGGRSAAPTKAAPTKAKVASLVPEEEIAPTGDIMGGGLGAEIMNAPARKESVLQGKKLPPIAPTEDRAVLNPQFTNAVEAQLNAMPAEERAGALAKLAERPDVYGRAAKAIAGRYQAMDKGTMLQASPTAAKVLDPRYEAQVERFMAQGRSREDAERDAMGQSTGYMRPDLQQMTRDVVGEQAGAEAAARAKELAGAGFWERVGAGAMSDLAKSGAGLLIANADLRGNKQRSNQFLNDLRIETEAGRAIPQGESIFEKSAQGAMTSLSTQAPLIALSALTGTPAPVLAQAAIQKFGSSYGEGRAAGLSGTASATRGIALSISEVIFERYGMTKALAGLKAHIAKYGVDSVPKYVAKAIATELPSEASTTTLDYIIDMAPKLGLNQNPSFADFYKQLEETVRQTILQAGATAGGTIAIAKGAQKTGEVLSKINAPREGAYQRDTSYEGLSDLIARQKGFLTPEQTQQQQGQQAPPPPPADTDLGAVGEARPGEDNLQPPAPPAAQPPAPDVEKLAQQIADTTSISLDDARRMARKKLGIKEELSTEASKNVPNVSKWTDAALQQTLAYQQQKPDTAPEVVDKETPLQERSGKNLPLIKAIETELQKRGITQGATNVGQPDTTADRTGDAVSSAADQTDAAEGVAEPERDGMVPAGEDVTELDGGKAGEPTAVKEAVTTEVVKEQAPVELSREEKLKIATDAELEEAKTKIGGSDISYLSVDKIQAEIDRRKAEAEAAVTKAKTKATKAKNTADVAVDENGNKKVKRKRAEGGGRKADAPEVKAVKAVARKEQNNTTDNRRFSKNKKNLLTELDEANVPLDEGSFENEDALAQAQEDQRAKKAYVINQMLDIEEANRGTALGIRVKDTLNDRTKISQAELDKVKKGREVRKKTNTKELIGGVNEYMSPSEGTYTTGPKYSSSKGKAGKRGGKSNPKFAKAKNAVQALTVIAKDGTPFERMLAGILRNFVVNVKFVVYEKGDTLPAELQKDMDRAYGLFDHDTNTVYVRGASWGEGAQGVNNVTILHEMLHAATDRRIAFGLANGNSQVASFVKKLNALTARIEDTIDERWSLPASHPNAVPQEIKDLVMSTASVDPATGEVSYDFFTPMEMVAYGLSHEGVQEFLQTIPGVYKLKNEQKPNAWSSFIRLFADFFKISPDNINALSDLMLISEKVLGGLQGLKATGEFAETGKRSLSVMPKTEAEKEAEAAQKQIRKAVADALAKTERSRTTQELGDSIGLLHAVKDPKQIIPIVKEAYEFADDKTKTALAGIPTFDFLAEWTKESVPELKNTNKLLGEMGGMSQNLLNKVGEMSETILREYKKDRKLRRKLENVVYTSTLAEIDPSDPNSAKSDPELTRMYNELGADGQRLYKMLKYYYQNMTDYYSDLLDKQVEQLNIADADKKNLLSVIRTIYEGEEKISPYFPLVRRGDFWLSVGENKKKQFLMFESKRQRDRAAKAIAASKNQTLKEALDTKDVRIGNNITELREASKEQSTLLRQIFNAIDSSDLTDVDAREELKDAIYQIYLQAMPEQSFRNQFIHRKGIEGFSTDLLRNINTTGAKMSVQLARIKYAPLLRTSLSQARSSIRATPEYDPFVQSAKNRVNAVLTAGRKGDTVDQVLDGLAGAANKASFFFYLSGASSGLIQPFSVYVTGLPILTATHGAGAAKELAKMVTYMNQYGVVRQNADGTKSYVAPSIANNQDLSSDERRAIKMMMQRGVTMSSYASEVFGYKSTPTEDLYIDPERGIIDNIPAVYGKGKRMASVLVGGLMHNMERLSREAIYLASFRLSMAKHGDFDRAVDQAVADTNECLGNYEMANRPLLMQKSGGKILLQFQMFPLHTYLLLLTNFKRMIFGLNGEGRREAAIKFFGILGTSASVAGITGVPFYSAVMGLLGWAWKEFGKDPDWPEDLKSINFDLWFRTVFLPKQLGTGAALLVERGALNKITGLDFASKLSLDSPWGRDTKETKTSRESVTAWAMSHGGPTASMILSLADAHDAWKLGDTKKAVEKAAPAILRNGAIFKRMSEEGIKDYRGAQIMHPDSIKTGELWGQMIGFRPAISADVLEKNFKFASIENRIENERAQILKRMDIALRNKNFGNYREAHADMNDFNKGFPSYRIEPDDLANSLEKKQEERGKSYVGVVPTEKNMAIFGSALVESRKPMRERQKETTQKKLELRNMASDKP